MSEITINYEEVSFGIISKVGEAKYLAMEAFNSVHKSDNYDDAELKLKEAEKLLNEAGSLHMDIISKEAEGNQLNFSVIFMHAEDQFLTIQTFVLTVRMLLKTIKKLDSK